MKDTDKNIALLVFTRTLLEEVKQKPILGKGKGSNHQLYQQLFRQLKRSVTLTSLDVIVWDSTKQTKSNFADNFLEAFHGVFQKGYDAVIAIGNDCPSLNHRDLIVAADHLQTRNYVIGPSKDGGVYLLGINKIGFNAEIFSMVRWQTNCMRQDFLRAIEINEYYCLPEKYDLDNYSDLIKFSKSKYSNPLALWLYLFFILLIDKIFIPHKKISPNSVSFVHGLRAPPTLLLR